MIELEFKMVMIIGVKLYKKWGLLNKNWNRMNFNYFKKVLV